MRYDIGGFFDKCAKNGEPTGSGPGFDAAAKRFNERRRMVGLRGKWRRAPAKYKTDCGTYIDPDWYIVNWGQ